MAYDEDLANRLGAALATRDVVARTVTRGREMDGWLRVDSEVVVDAAELEAWVGRGVAFVGTLPPK